MEANIPRMTRTDNPNWDCLIFQDNKGKVDFRLFPSAEHVLYDEKGMPVNVLPWPSRLNLEQTAAGYERVNHNIADAVRGLLNPKGPEYHFQESEFYK